MEDSENQRVLENDTALPYKICRIRYDLVIFSAISIGSTVGVKTKVSLGAPGKLQKFP